MGVENMNKDIQNQKFEKKMKEVIQRFVPALNVCFFVTAILVAILAVTCLLTDISSTKKGMTLVYI